MDLLIGDPAGIPHPIVWIGHLITALEEKLYPSGEKENDEKAKRRAGTVLCVTVLSVTAFLTFALLFICYRIHPVAGVIVEAILTCYILAAKSLYRESMKVYTHLPDEPEEARMALSMIVGRDTANLSEEKILSATVETVAENTSDGVIAPLIYTMLGGPLLGLVYKAVNTMDSMLGYKNERYLHFGRCAAKTDDVFNLLPSRISAYLLLLSGALAGIFSKNYHAKDAVRIYRRDRHKHLSPNAAQTESACAGILGIRLGGDSTYHGVLVHKPYIGDAKRNIEKEDIKRANMLMFAAETLAVICYMGMICLIYGIIKVI